MDYDHKFAAIRRGRAWHSTILKAVFIVIALTASSNDRRTLRGGYLLISKAYTNVDFLRAAFSAQHHHPNYKPA
jgi:hypothetical protein